MTRIFFGKLGVSPLCVRAAIIIAACVMLLASVLGWFAYQANPRGVFLYTPRDWCIDRTHPFVLSYSLVHLVAAVVLLLTGLVSRVLMRLTSLANRGTQLKTLSHAALLSILLVGLSSMVSVPVSYLLPLQTSPDCVGKV